jgi:hypothetical protein
MFRTTLVAACMVASLPLRADESPAAQKVPFEMLSVGSRLSGHMAVNVKINGKGPYRLIFDTGAPTMLVSSKVAKEAGLIGPNAKKPAKRGNLMMPGQVVIDTVEIGGVTASELQAVVLDHPIVKAIGQVFGPVEGIVGFPFFARFRMAIDYQARELTLEPNGYQPGDVMTALMTALMPKAGERGKPAPRILAPAALWGFRVSKSADDAEPGVMIENVFTDGPAARAGLKAGDRLLTMDGRWTDNIADVFQAAEFVKPGTSVDLRVRRGDEERIIRVTPAQGF